MIGCDSTNVLSSSLVTLTRARFEPGTFRVLGQFASQQATTVVHIKYWPISNTLYNGDNRQRLTQCCYKIKLTLLHTCPWLRVLSEQTRNLVNRFSKNVLQELHSVPRHDSYHEKTAADIYTFIILISSAVKPVYVGHSWCHQKPPNLYRWPTYRKSYFLYDYIHSYNNYPNIIIILHRAHLSFTMFDVVRKK
jgi:hypothetical protein